MSHYLNSCYCLELTLYYQWFHSLSQCNFIHYQNNLHSLSKSFQIQYCLNPGLVSVAYFLCQLLGAPSTRIAPTSGIQDSQVLTLQLELFPTLLASAHQVSFLIWTCHGSFALNHNRGEVLQ